MTDNESLITIGLLAVQVHSFKKAREEYGESIVLANALAKAENKLLNAIVQYLTSSESSV
jgi:hypothetical protein